VDERLAAAYRLTDYRIRLPGHGYVSLRIGRPPPERLQALAGQAHWGFITAWNPGAVRVPVTANRQAQRALLAELRSEPATDRILPGIGVGPSGWHEASLFVVGPGRERFRQLCHSYGQLACVVGRGAGAAELLWTIAA